MSHGFGGVLSSARRNFGATVSAATAATTSAVATPVISFDPVTQLTWGHLWRADSGCTLSGSPSTDGGLVDSWATIAGGALSVTGTLTRRPTYRSAGINSKPCVDFNGTFNGLSVTGTPAANAQPNTLVVVFKFNSTQSGARTIIDGDAARQAIYKGTSPHNLNGYAGTLGSNSGLVPGTSTQIAIYKADGASSTIRMGGSTSSAINWGTSALTGFWMGASSGYTQLADVRIAMAGWIDGLTSSTDDNNLHAWAQSYYGAA